MVLQPLMVGASFKMRLIARCGSEYSDSLNETYRIWIRKEKIFRGIEKSSLQNPIKNNFPLIFASDRTLCDNQ